MAQTRETGSIGGFAPPVLAVGAVAAIHIGSLAVLPEFPPLQTVALIEGIGLLAVVGTTALGEGIGRPLAVSAVLYAVVTSGTVALIVLETDLLLATLVVVSVLALVSYGLHRYELVMLDLVEAADE
ncbi:hypothetical protein [Haloarcula montana]|uniref:hypothetical protein n=1 Tax=Haloarcula montana TaxID=3111776 RepID=UPI002D794C62|nr:hypothetical protein [Haloarcula sp. GH36]